MLASENARLRRLIENFLTFSRLERGRQQFALHAGATVVARRDGSRRRSANGARRSANSSVDVAPDLPPVMADADALVTALVNLLDNALKYTPDDKRIVVRATRTATGSSRFDVTDNGIGIPAREQRRIFRRFYRVDQRLARETAGVGLGLSIVELIVRAHGGSVSVQSAPAQAARSLCVSRAPPGAGGMSAGRVLLIEDEPALARGLSDTLRARGFDVTVAADGERASTPRSSGRPT